MEDVADWTLDETADLFANLDNIAETNVESMVSPGLSTDVFLNRLQDSLANARPLDQIIDKLQEHHRGGNFHDVYKRGSRCMKLDADMRWRVESKLVAIRVATPRQLRSSSRKRDRVSVTPTSSLPAKPVGPSARLLKRLRSDSMDKVRVIRVVTIFLELVTDINYSNSWPQANIHQEVGLD